MVLKREGNQNKQQQRPDSRSQNLVKQWIRNIHLALGLTSGAVVLVVALTGCLYVFEEELRQVFQHRYLYVQPQDNPKLPVDALTATVRQAWPADTLSLLRFKEQANAAAIFHTRSRKIISVNPYTGQIIGTRHAATDFFSVVLDLHRHLLMGDVGEEIVRWNVLIFFVMCLTGLALWWPAQRKFLRQSLTIRWSAAPRVRTWDMHRVLGFYGLAVLLVISLTGIFWMFDWAKSAVRWVTDSPKPKEEKLVSSDTLASGVFSADAAYAVLAARQPGATDTYIYFPRDAGAPLRVMMRYPYAIVRKQSAVWFDQYSGRVLKEEFYQNYTGYDKVWRSSFDFHTGRIRVLGIGSKIIYFFASLFAASLPVTGFLMWRARRVRKKKAEIV
jgi:uncharacterized iron-regulated membrane protein